MGRILFRWHALSASTLHDVTIRHAFAPLGLSIITFGIYGLVWYYKINRECRDLGEDVEPGMSVLAITLGTFLIIPPFVSFYKTGERVGRAQTRVLGGAASVSGVVTLLLAIIPIASLFWMAYVQSGMNKVGQRYAAVSR